MRSFIFGTDWGEDCDDCVALRILSRYHKAGKAKLLGVCINTCDENSAGSLYGFLRKEGVEDVIVGVDKDVAHLNIEAKYQPRLAKYAPEISNDDVDNAVRVYRKILSEATEKVEIIEVGFLQTLARALESEGDDISPKTGMELFSEKVSKLWVMGGKYVEQGDKEYNFSRHIEACVGASVVCERMPCPITFLGWEIGSRLITGDKLDKDDFLYDVLCDHGCPTGRESWDPMLTLMALIGDEKKAGYSTVNASIRVDSTTGANYFVPDESSNRKYVIKDYEDSYYSNMINEIIK